MEIKVGDFVYFKNIYIWDKAKKWGFLNKFEEDNPGYVTGQVIGTYGPWDDVPNSKFHWNIYCNCTVQLNKMGDELSWEERYDKYGFDCSGGSSQIEPQFVFKDFARSRDWYLSFITNDFNWILENRNPNELNIEKEILYNNIKDQWLKSFSKRKMLILLDIDGVMVPIKSWKSPELLEDDFPDFTESSVNILKKLVSDSTTILLTTSHRDRFSINEWKDIFIKRGIEIKNLIKLDSNTEHLSRKDEIINLFKSKDNFDDILIIDDDRSLNELPLHLKDRLILTDSMLGLLERNIRY